MDPKNDCKANVKLNISEKAIKRVKDWRMYAMKKHDATRLHYDLRLEWEGMLLSWALPVGPSYRAGLLREAVEMPDHDPANINFEGVHSTGPIMVWDYGVWVPHQDHTDIGECLRKGVLRFIIYGGKLEGGWTLTRTDVVTYAGNPKWSFCKDLDSNATDETYISVLEEKPNSALTGRTMEQIVFDWNHPPRKRKGQMKLFEDK